MKMSPENQKLMQRVIDDLVSAGAKVMVVAENENGEVDYTLRAKFEDGTIWHIELIKETEEQIIVEGTEEKSREDN